MRIAEIKYCSSSIFPRCSRKKNIFRNGTKNAKSGFSSKFYEAHRADIQLHKAAKDVFNKQGVKKLPKITELNKEFSEILSAKKADYAEYKKVKSEMQEYLIAKQNLEALLNSGSGEKEERAKEKNIIK